MKPFFENDFAALVPEEHSWVSRWVAACERLGVPLRRTNLADGGLRMVLDGDEEAWTVEVRLSNGQPSWRSVGGYALTYQGPETLDGAATNVLERLARILEKFAPHLPNRFKGFAFVGQRDDDPAAALGAMFPFATVERSAHSHGEVIEVLVRTTSVCNQRCPFCSGPKHDHPTEVMVQACIETAGRWLPGCLISLTGGEPTLKPSFSTELDVALAAPGVAEIQVQSNGVGFAKRVDPAGIPASDRLRFFVSCHGVDPAVYDENTGTEGQFDDALAGLDRVIAAGHRVTVNTVITSANLEHLTEMAHFLANRYPPGRRPLWHLSVLICPDHSPLAAEYLVDYRELVPAVEALRTLAADLGLEVQSLLSSTHAAVPPCTVSSEHRAEGRAAPTIGLDETGYEDFSRPWVKSNRCRTCSQDSRCLGVPTPYAQRFGLSGLDPIPPDV